MADSSFQVRSATSDDIAKSIHSLSPLPPFLKHGLTAVTFFGFLSFISTISLLAFLTFKIVRWILRPIETAQSAPTPDHLDQQPNFSPDQIRPQQFQVRSSITRWQRLKNDPPNQFLILIINLLFADAQQSIAFLLNASWLARDGVFVGNSLCWAQGWFVSTGDLASSVFIFLIAIHTYLTVLHGHRMKSWVFYSMIGFGWFFNYFVAVLGIILTRNGADTGGFYVRAGSWCWVNSAYQDLRFALHYLWIFISLGLTSALYLVVFFHIRKIAPTGSSNDTTMQRPSHMKNGYSSTGPSRRNATLEYAKKQTFLLYPIIYVCCTMPLAAGRVASMAGSDPTLSYFCFAAAMIASNGWMDVLLYASTRRDIVFSDNPASQETGLETFAFMRTPNRRFGNVVFVAGGTDANADETHGRKKIGKLSRLRGEAGQSEVSLRGVEHGSSERGGRGNENGMAIQMETVTSVVVEIDNTGTASTGSRRKGSLASDAVSVASRV